MTPSRQDIEFTFIRSLACGGFILSGPHLSIEDRRERIRVAIMKLQMGHEPLPIAPSLTYSQAFKMVYNCPCELRRVELERYAKARSRAAAELFEGDDETEENEAELGWL
jgi:hypothetical protein